MPGRTVIQWDKNDLDALGLLKVDCLALGMLTAVQKCLHMVKQHHDKTLTLATIPSEDPAVYRMLQKADSVGVFQVESRAQMAMLPRLKPRCFYDLVIEVSLVRPGPIQGDMVHPYLRRRAGEELPDYPNDAVRAVLERTLGVPIFQEQAMKLAEVAAGFSPGEADQLRRAMGAWRRPGIIDLFQKKLMTGLAKNGYSKEYAERLFNQIRGFGEYGFPESHAASFALLVYASSWLKCHYPAAFCAALLNSQPMGFYAPAQLVNDAKQHGVAVRSVDVCHSDWDCTLEPSRCRGGVAVRLGLRMIRGLRSDFAQRLVAVRQQQQFTNMADFARRSRFPKAALTLLATAGACGTLMSARRQAAWHALGEGERAPLYEMRSVDSTSAAAASTETVPPLPPLTPPEEVVADYRSTGLSLNGHPIAFLRPELDRRNVRCCETMKTLRNNVFIKIAGLVLLRQRPGSAKGITFLTLEDETGQANLVIYPDVWEQFRGAARTASALLAAGRLQRDGGGTLHLVVARLDDLSAMLSVSTRARDFH